MPYKKLLTVQDISCVGQCSLTVALPILSAAGHETCILPSAVLSTHTAGFTGFTCRDLTEDMPSIAAHWKKEGIKFDAIYTGYLGSAAQIAYVKDMFATLGKDDLVTFVDPAMADNGRLYPAFDEAYIRALLDALHASGMKTVVLTGVSYTPETTGVAVSDGKSLAYYEHRRIPKGSHGTGDVYASAFVGAYLRGKTAYEAAGIAAEYTVRCIENTQGDPDHWYGVKFEPLLPYYIEQLD